MKKYLLSVLLISGCVIAQNAELMQVVEMNDVEGVYRLMSSGKVSFDDAQQALDLNESQSSGIRNYPRFCLALGVWCYWGALNSVFAVRGGGSVPVFAFLGTVNGLFGCRLSWLAWDGYKRSEIREILESVRQPTQ